MYQYSVHKIEQENFSTCGPRKFCGSSVSVPTTNAKRKRGPRGVYHRRNKLYFMNTNETLHIDGKFTQRTLKVREAGKTFRVVFFVRTRFVLYCMYIHLQYSMSHHDGSHSSTVVVHGTTYRWEIQNSIPRLILFPITPVSFFRPQSFSTIVSL
jgi:hypothetical protein